MDYDKKIEELRSEIKRLEKEREVSQVEKYQYLVGTCLHRAYTSWEKITEINRVEYDEHSGDEINFDSISMYFDPTHDREDTHNRDPHISFGSYSDIYANDIERYLISNEKFEEVFEECVKYMRTKVQGHD
jgi:hypothetical protein